MIVALLLAAVLAITGAFAYLTAQDSAENKFTVGNVDIELTEPNWDENNGENIVAGQVLAKDPTIKNTGVNDAYVYFQVEIPKVYKTDIVGEDGTATEMTDYPLFTMQTKNGNAVTDLVAFDDDGEPYSTNSDFVIVESFIDDSLAYAYDYYVFAYVGETKSNDTVKLFNQVKFANITETFENLANGTTDEDGVTTFPAITKLQVRVKAYAIQSDFYSNEATDAASAWELYVNQNDWAWDLVQYEGISTIEYVDESDIVVYSESNYVGAPVTMYFEPSLAKTGYTFDWVNANTNEVAYSGMPMPENDTTLKAAYTETGYGSEISEFINYGIKYSDEWGYYAEIMNTGGPNVPAEPAITIVPSHITFTLPKDVVYNSPNAPKYADGAPHGAELLDEGGYTFTVYANIKAGTYTVPVLSDASGNYSNGITKISKVIVYPDTIQKLYNFYADNNAENAKFETNPLEEIIIPYGVKEVGVFFDYLKLKELYLPNSVTSFVGFSATTSATTTLDRLELPSSLTKSTRWGSISIGTLIINSDVEGLGLNTGTTVENLIFAEGVTKIPDEFCEALSGGRHTTFNNLSLPSTLKTIGAHAFRNAPISSIAIPNNVTSIGYEAFKGCTSLENVTIPNGVTSIDDGVFRDCTNLSSITIPGSVTSIGDDAFRNCTSLTSISIPDSVTSIGSNAFNKCTNLTSISIPNSVTSIGDYAFSNCSNLTTASVLSTCTLGTSVFPSKCKVTYR